MVSLRLLTSLLTLWPTLGYPYPSHQRLHRRAAVSGEPLDDGNQPICLSLPTALTSNEVFKAKVRPQSEETCQVKTNMLLAAAEDDPYVCDENKPCSNKACCGKSGNCGYGPKYCGTNDKSPNDKCWSNCDAKAECGRYAKEKGTKCPLNVCCSQHGFCGMTSEYCEETDDEAESCQSNCKQPGSGSSGGDVQKRVIGYYEAWNYKKKCIGMRMEDIPVNSLTHIYYSFAYIKPDSYDIIPMDDEKDGKLSTDTFTKFAGLKRKNTDLKVIIALGGWTFNDNHTIYQPVFSDLSSTEAKRGQFIDKLLTFLSRYGFDGVDIDWEYPGAGDRGGHDEDGVNFTKLLKQMREAFDDSGGSHKEISFTAPTSYWYLRHFDIEASAKAVDFVNIMSYDLHGIWDSDNPIGSKVLAHTNLSEINSALDLFWRNKVDPAKLNLGLGFYGRSFQLADPGCYKPGCIFKGGAAPGPCTDNSGTLSYFEIMDIIKEHDLTPYYDEDNAVKYVTWNGDQWVSYDDFDTFQQKIDFANALGLGGVLIWAIDLDTKDLDALEAVLYPESLGTRAEPSTANNWETLDKSHCRITECGTTGCGAGELKIKEPGCGGGKKRTICCPFASAPDPDKCTWRGNDPSCNGRCHSGEVALASSLYGSGGKCLDGRKFLCCEAEAKMPDCRWTLCNEDCDGDTEDELTWRSNNCGFGGSRMKFCCNKDDGWTNCGWHGKPGSCFDNHCDTGWQVALTTNHQGEGKDCGMGHLERQRSFCCDPPDGESPFLPVPLEYLFEDPPDSAEADTDFALKVDNTWGGAEPGVLAETPENSAFGFVVLTSPEELQVSLDKRDGSHWDVFDCFDGVTEGEHRVRMVCTDGSQDSNCHRIHLGHGAPGTIVEMPAGCGPGKYAVAKTLTPSANQSWPHHVVRRGNVGPRSDDTVYDLVFDYDFGRVPRDLGDTQMRIDYSNEPEYWDRVVDKAADHKKTRKRSVDGNYKRWLEDEWRDQVHYGGVTSEELHRRWFGEDVVDWLKGLINGVKGGLDVSHSYSEDFILQIIDQRVQCPNVEAKLDVHAETHVDVDVNYGFTLIAKLDGKKGIDISDSYLYFRNQGEVTAKFVVDAAVTAMFDTGDILMFSADRFGAAFTVPGIVTIGPNFKLFGRLEGEATLGVNFESRVKLAEWDVRQTYPVANDDWDPEASESPKKDGTQNVLEPDFGYGVSLSGHLTAHVKPTITFGIDFNEKFVSIDTCAINLVADGHVTFHAKASTGSEGSEFCYGIDAGADLYATIDAPEAFGWALPESPFPIVPIDDVQIYPTNGESACTTSSKTRRRRSVDSPLASYANASSPLGWENDADSLSSPSALGKRAQVYGPLVPRIDGLLCPGDVEVGDEPPCPLCTSNEKRADADGDDEDDAGETCAVIPSTPGNAACRPADTEKRHDFPLNHLVKRATKELSWEYKGTAEILNYGDYDSCAAARDAGKVNKWFGYRGTKAQCTVPIEKLEASNIDLKDTPYVTEHVYEAQLIKMFLTWLVDGNLPVGYTNPTRDWVSEVIINLGQSRGLEVGDWDDVLFYEMTKGLGSQKNPGGLALADQEMNNAKLHMFAGNDVSTNTGDNDVQRRRHHRHVAGVFSYMRNSWIWPKFQASSQHMEKKLADFDDGYYWGKDTIYNDGELTVPSRDPAQPQFGLRDLYCYWIDMLLANIELKAEAWLTAAAASYRQDYGNTPSGQTWLKDTLNEKGLISTKTMKFPAAKSKHGPPNPNSPKIWAQSNYEDLWLSGPGFGPAGPF